MKKSSEGALRGTKLPLGRFNRQSSLIPPRLGSIGSIFIWRPKVAKLKLRRRGRRNANKGLASGGQGGLGDKAKVPRITTLI